MESECRMQSKCLGFQGVTTHCIAQTHYVRHLAKFVTNNFASSSFFPWVSGLRVHGKQISGSNFYMLVLPFLTSLLRHLAVINNFAWSCSPLSDHRSVCKWWYAPVCTHRNTHSFRILQVNAPKVQHFIIASVSEVLRFTMLQKFNIFTLCYASEAQIFTSLGGLKFD